MLLNNAPIENLFLTFIRKIKRALMLKDFKRKLRLIHLLKGYYRIRGEVRLQKRIRMYSDSGGEDLRYVYIKNKYGPTSKTLENDLRDLTNEGYLPLRIINGENNYYPNNEKLENLAKKFEWIYPENSNDGLLAFNIRNLDEEELKDLDRIKLFYSLYQLKVELIAEYGTYFPTALQWRLSCWKYDANELDICTPKFNLNEIQEIMEILESNEIARTIFLKKLQDCARAHRVNERMLTRKLLRHCHHNFNLLKDNGLWVIPTLLPYPLNWILPLLREGSFKKAKKVLLSYCSPKFIQTITSNWWDLDEFQRKQTFIEEALMAHCEGSYLLVIPSLSPLIEGIIRDFLKKNGQNKSIPQQLKSKIEMFRDTILKKSSLSSVNRKITMETSQFLLKGPFLNGSTTDAPVFVSRHKTAHGALNSRSCSEESSVRLFLLLDTLYHLIKSFYFN